MEHSQQCSYSMIIDTHKQNQKPADTIILKQLDSHFLQYDYIGAPFSNREIGNGGLSLRSKSIMIQICEKYFDLYKKQLEKSAELLNRYKSKIQAKYGNTYYNNKALYFFYKIEENLLEDLQITNKMRQYKIGKLPSFPIGTLFSIEKYYNEKAFGGHQFWYCIDDVSSWLDRKLRY